jgi:hypothetical protein
MGPRMAEVRGVEEMKDTVQKMVGFLVR